MLNLCFNLPTSRQQPVAPTVAGCFVLQHTKSNFIVIIPMKVTIQIPADLNDVKLWQYQEYAKTEKINEEVEDKEFVIMKLVSIVTGAPMDALRKIPMSKYDVICQEVAKLFDQPKPFKRIIEVDGKEYGFIPNLDNISLGEYVDLEAFLADPKDYHKAMGVMYRPLTMKAYDTYLIEPYEPMKYDDVMKDAGVADTLGAVLFFWTLGSELVKATRNSLQEDLKAMITASAPSSARSGDGIKVSTILQTMTYLDSMLSQPFLYTNVYKNWLSTRKKQTSKRESIKEQ